MADDAIVITGATATGKTAVAIAVAKRVGGEIISMDSRQVYRGMDVGTAKPPPSQRGGVPHHGFDLVDPDERFNAGAFARLARGWMGAIRQRGHLPVLTGGTGFFLRALTHPLFEEPPLDPRSKERWKRYLRTLPAAELSRWAAALDPASTSSTGDRQRLARIIEVVVLTGRPLWWWHAHAQPAAGALEPAIFVLELPRDMLYRRIEERVDQMERAGLVQELTTLIERGYGEDDAGMNATGYIELIPCFRGERTIPEALDLVKAATRRYARRQVTWFRHQLPPGARRLDATLPHDELAETIARAWRERT
jgi:tRNA dimethylallyltransferase